MINQLVRACFAVLAAAVAIYVAIRLIESVAAVLVVIGAVIGGLVMAGVIGRLLWRRQRMDRW